MKILFHICCGNCALYPFKLMKSEGHDLTGFWFNPNIHPYEEYKSRLDSVKKLSGLWGIDMSYVEEYKPESFFRMFNSPHSAIDAFSTTLLISPFQGFDEIADTGAGLAEKYNVLFHLKDFRPYFRDSSALSKEMGLYRQKYCGCIYSRDERFSSKRKTT
jgi:predicted adenine nucleotide alpha hydrolase (AANH) superfamily ATPase